MASTDYCTIHLRCQSVLLYWF